MKQVIHILTSFFMTIVVLVSTMSFTIDKHYCGNKLVDAAFFKKAHTCGVKMEKSATKECSIMKKNCCSDKQISIDGQDELKISFDSLTIEHQLFLTSFVHSYISLFDYSNEQVIAYTDYRPPIVVKTIYKLDETYLI